MNEQKQLHCRVFCAHGFCTWIFVFGQEQKRREDKHVRQCHVTEQFRALLIRKQSVLLLRKKLFLTNLIFLPIPCGFLCELKP